MSKQYYPPISQDAFNSLLYAIIFTVATGNGSSAGPGGILEIEKLYKILEERGIRRGVVDILVTFLSTRSILGVNEGYILFGKAAKNRESTKDEYDPQWAVQMGMAALDRLPKSLRQGLLQQLGDELGDISISIWPKSPGVVSNIQTQADEAQLKYFAQVHRLVSKVRPHNREPSFDLYLDPGDAPVEAIVELFAALSAMHEVHGGEPLIFVQDGQGVIFAGSAVQ
jgi:hypothetical protein